METKSTGKLQIVSAKEIKKSGAKSSRSAVRPAKTDSHKVLLLDGHSLAFRAFFALPDTLVTSSGQVTNAVYGFTAMLIKLLADERPQVVVVCFDTAEMHTLAQRYAQPPEHAPPCHAAFRPRAH